MKTHYDLLGLDSSADVETIKKAFRREIAKYHPDKVTHLGAEFQEMASTRAAELTAAYKILTNPEQRAEYDEALLGDLRASAPGAAAQNTRAVTYEPTIVETEATSREAAPRTGFEEERAGKDDIVRRATLMRVREALRQVIGDCETPSVAGFDFACVPRSRPVTSRSLAQLFTRQTPPIVLARITAMVDAQLATDAFSCAVRARLDPKAPLVVLLIGNNLASNIELGRAIELARKKSPAIQDRLFIVPIDGRDWSARVPVNTPDAVRAVLDRLKSSV